MNSEMTAVARGLKCGGLGAYGFVPTAATAHGSSGGTAAESSPCCSSIQASASPLIPPPERNRNSRRSQKLRLQRCDTRSPHVDELVEVQHHVRKSLQRPCGNQRRADFDLCRRRRPCQRDRVGGFHLRLRIACLLADA